MSEPTALAAQRLALSRELLRLAMRPGGTADDPAGRDQAAATADSGRGAARADSRQNWLSCLREWPGVEIVMEVVRQRWQRHPLRLAAQVAGDVADVRLRPLAREHPVRLVLGALVVGGVLAWARPWRLLPRPARWAALAIPVVSRAVALVPLDPLLIALTALARQSIRRDSPNSG